VNVLIACEFSGVVRDAFRSIGHNAWSCDVLPCEGDSRYHIQGDVRDVLRTWHPPTGNWGLMIAHPPCTHLAVSGARWFKDKVQAQAEAIEFVEMLWDADVPRVCIENPVGVLSTRSKLGKATQYIQPWQFGHGETKKTGLWLRGLPPLVSTNIVEGREGRVWKMPPGPDRWKERSRTYAGIAAAMADQWGNLPNPRRSAANER
jgi:site-specific DNA-cytosine methylase